jgi:hypothetical protein
VILSWLPCRWALPCHIPYKYTEARKTSEVLTNLPIQGWQKNIGGARWSKKGYVLRKKKIMKKRQAQESSHREGKVSKKDFPTDRLPFNSSKLGR